MVVDYKDALEKSASQMILVHRVETLVRLILRSIIRNLHVSHAGLLLLDKNRGEYVIKVSRGARGSKIPAGFAKIRRDNPLIRFFTDKTLPDFLDRHMLLLPRINSALRSSRVLTNHQLIGFLHNLKSAFSLYEIKAAVPGFFREELMLVILLGDKEDHSSFNHDELGYLSVLSSDIVMAIRNATLFEDLNNQLEVNRKLLLNTVTALATAIEAKDKYTLGHTERVVQYSLQIAHNLNDPTLSWDFEENLRIAALLHDIGKIGIPEEILNKKAPLTPEERAQIERHPILGSDILSPINEFKSIITGVKFHHERYDGSGYPFRLSADQIPLNAAVISVADAYDSMTTDRPYRKALSRTDAVEEIIANSGKQFDPKVTDAFLLSFDI